MKIHGRVTQIVAAIAALAVSGIALAKHEPDHSNGKGPKSSIEITNTCTVIADTSGDVEPPAHKLQVVTDIKDTSDDDRNGYMIDTTSAAGQQLVKGTKPPKKASWGDLGTTSPPVIEEDKLTFEILLCNGYHKLNDDASALNATVQVKTVDGANVIGRCDDNDMTEDKDESIVLPVDSQGKRISCNTN